MRLGGCVCVCECADNDCANSDGLRANTKYLELSTMHARKIHSYEHTHTKKQ